MQGIQKTIDKITGEGVVHFPGGEIKDVGAEISHVISYQPDYMWTRPKQVAMWLSELGNIELDGSYINLSNNGSADLLQEYLIDSTNPEIRSSLLVFGAKILAEAYAYQEFYNIIKDETGDINENNIIEDNTNINNVTIQEKSENGKNYYIIGPYNIKHLNGQYVADVSCFYHQAFWEDVLNYEGNCAGATEVIFGGIADIGLKITKTNGTTKNINSSNMNFQNSVNDDKGKVFDLYNPIEKDSNGKLYGYVEGCLRYDPTNNTYELYDPLTDSGEVTPDEYQVPIKYIVQYPESGEDFYIKVESTKIGNIEDIEKVKLDVEYKWIDINKDKGIVRLNGEGTQIKDYDYTISNDNGNTYNVEFSIKDSGIDIQDLLVGEAERILKSKKISNEFTIEKNEFDLSLRKYIKSINGKSVNRTKDGSGNLKIDMSNLQNETGTTAVYNFDKNPIEVHKGDTIRYEIKVYNEGNTDGYAKEIIDYLPEGLILKEDSDINRLVGWQELPQNNGETRKKVSTTSLADNRIKAYNGENAENFDRKGKSIQIECVVDPEANIPDNTVLKNVAEIARDLANNTPDIDDRDSNTGDLSTSLSYNGQRPKYEPMDDDEDYEQVLFKNNNVLNLEGYVWDDAKEGKESLADGIFNQSSDPTNKDRALGNIKVTLYYEDGKMVPQSDLKPEEGTEIRYKINPTLTAEDGYYMFCGLDSTKKYYVEYEYNGQKYLPTEHKEYGARTNFQKSSVGIESDNNRKVLDTRFQEIKSSPKSYKSTNSLGYGISDNITFTNLELMGYTLKYKNGKYQYEQDKEQLIDGYLYNENGTLSTTYKNGVISDKINDYIGKNGKYPDENAMRTIYNGIVGNNTELKQKLQFIEDCKIKAYTSEYKNGTSSRKVYGKEDATDGDIINLNLGLWERQQFDLHLWKDVEDIDLVIKGKSEKYKYDSVFKKPVGPEIDMGNMYDRLVTDENPDTNSTESGNAARGEINSERANQDRENAIRINNKYHKAYEKKLYTSDYQYLRSNRGMSGNNTKSDDSQVKIKYKIEIYNESQSVIGKVTEVVDNFVTSLKYVEGSIEAKKGDTQITTVKVDTNTRYSGTEENISGYNKIYITGLENIELQSGESIYIYLTFIADMSGENAENVKQNIAEINGFKTYYKNNTELPNGVIKSSKDISGLIDRDSLPGNLTGAHLQGEHFAANLQDDTDMAHAMKFTSGNPREINGIVWEDQKGRNTSIGNGKLDNGEKGISGITVYLKKQSDNETAELWNGNKWVTAKTATGENGEYSFKGFLPGDYYVEFEYGKNESEETDVNKNLSDEEKYELLKKKAQYNGQDYKSTIFTNNINNEYNIANETYKFDETDNARVSDAIDNWERRENVNKYSEEQINHIAEVLSSPSRIPAYPKVNSEGVTLTLIGGGIELEQYNKQQMIELLEELMSKTYMTARTAKIDVGIEYKKGSTIGGRTNSSKEEAGYVIKNVDFGLIERPTAQLKIDKKVKNVKVTLSDGTILFDAVKEEKNLGWIPGELIHIFMDKELMYGATIQITYGMKVKNEGEEDYTTKAFYVKGIKGTPDQLVTTSAEEVICYVPNNMQFDKDIAENKGKWGTVSKETIFASTYETEKKEQTDEDIIRQVTGARETNKNIVNAKLQQLVEKRNAVILTEALKGNLKPGDSSEEIKLVISKLISTDTGLENSGNSNDDLSYVSVAEIVKIKNTVGRKMNASILGNQNPDLGQNHKPSEIDAAKGETVMVTPPTGTSNVFYYTLAVAVVAILAIGIILIKKKVINK